MPQRAFPAPRRKQGEVEASMAEQGTGTSPAARAPLSSVARGTAAEQPPQVPPVAPPRGGSALSVLLSSSEGDLEGRNVPGNVRSLRPRAAHSRGERSPGAEDASTSRPEERAFRCPKCRDKQILLTATGEHVRASACSCLPTCSTCQGRGYAIRRAPNGYLYHADCVCRQLHRRLERFNQAQVPAHYARADLENFETTRHNLLVLEQARRYAQDFVPGQPDGLLMYGDPGGGKTHLAVGILKVLVFEKGVQCLFKDFFLLLSEVRYAYSEGRFDSELLRPLTEVEVLIIDELGKGRSNSDWEQALLDEIICRRYNQLKTTLFTTNFPLPDEKRGSADSESRTSGNLSSRLERPNLEERVGDRMFSRIKQMCSMLQVTGQDYRRTHTVNSLQGRKL